MTDPFVEHRIREIEKFEARARGDNTAAIAAKVATQLGAEPMNYHQTETISTGARSLFQPAEVTSAYLKTCVMGFQGSGKTKTATKVVIGLVQHMRELGIAAANKPVKFLDTETGSDWVIPDFRAAGVRLDQFKSRAFSDLLMAVDEAEQEGAALIIDSGTHFWMELTQSYMKKKNRTRLQFEDWGHLKLEWGKFTDRFVNSSAHIAFLGRAGFEYDYTVDEETQKKNLEKTGIKMKAEGEMGYESSLLVLMERQQEIEANKIKRVWRTATILKDRSALIDGNVFEDPGFEQFLPHIQMLNLGGRQMGVDTSRNSQHMIAVDKKDWQPVQRRIVHDEIKDLLLLHFPGQTAQEKTGKVRALLDAFNASWAEIEEVMPLVDLRAGYDKMHVALTGRSSKYGAVIARDAETLEINDSLPAFATLGQVTEKVVTETLVPATPVDTETLSPNGIPAFLDRNAPAKPADPEFDESKWLSELTRAFGDCLDFAAFGEKQQTLMAPIKPKVTPQTWKKATKLAAACVTRLVEGPGGAAVAAE